MAKLYTLGKGEVHFAPFKADTQTPDGYDFLGNVPEFNFTREIEKLDHFSSTEGLRQKDQSVIIEVMTQGTMTADEVRYENLAYFMGTEPTIKTIASATAEESTFDGVKQGRRYQIGVTSTAPDGARAISNVVVEDATPTTYVLTDDYTVDLDLGLLYIVPGGGIADDTDLTVTFDVAAQSRTIIEGSEIEIEGAMKFISKAPVGNRVDWFFPWVKLTPNGDLNLISEEWMTIPFNMEILKPTDLAVAYVGGRAIVDA